MWEFFEELFHHPPSALHQNYILLGGFILLFGLVSLFVKERLYLTESLVATLVGVLMGPHGFGVVDPQRWFDTRFHYFLSEAARIVIGLQVMAVGVSVPGEFLRKHWSSILMMLGPVMAFMWAVSAMSVHYALGLPWLESLIIAACITPTDPVLAHSVIKGKFAERYIPTRLRNLLAVESGANDGLGFPFMMLPIWLILKRESPGSALLHWALHTWVWEIFGSIVVGCICGFTARWLLRASIARKLIDKESFLVFTIALTLFVSGLVALMASDDLFAIFVAGNVFAWDEKFAEAYDDSHISEVIDMIFNISFFVFFGSIIPWGAFVGGPFGLSRLMLCAALVLLLRRLPVVMVLRGWIGSLGSRKEAFFAGWFGPMGVGALFFAVQARTIFQNNPGASIEPGFLDDIFTVVCFIVLSSILIHGITVPLTNSHLKRRMKRKVKRRNKLARQLAEMAQLSTDLPAPGELLSPAASEAVAESVIDSPLASPGSPAGLDQDEYIYITDDEGIHLMMEAGDEDGLFDSPIGPTDVVVGGTPAGGASPIIGERRLSLSGPVLHRRPSLRHTDGSLPGEVSIPGIPSISISPPV